MWTDEGLVPLVNWEWGITANNNPEGCNQYKDCAGGTDGGGKLQSALKSLNALKDRAVSPDADHRAIATELTEVLAKLPVKGVMAVAKAMGVIRHMSNRAEAVAEVTHKVLEMKIARDSILY